MTIAARPRMTEAEFMRLPDEGRRYELVDGTLEERSIGFRDAILCSNLVFALGPFARGRGFLTTGNAGFRLRAGTVRCPDTSFTRKERLPEQKPPEGFADLAPDLCVEFPSLSEKQGDRERARREYFAAGTSQMWHLIPDERRVIVFRSPDDGTMLGAEDELDGGDLLPGFRCRVAELFELE